MIHFSFSSMLITILVSNLLLVFISLLFQNNDVLTKIGFRLTAIFCIITLIRLLLPFEFPFAKTLILPDIVSNPLSTLRHRHNVLPNVWISVWNIIGMIWLIGSICSLICLFYNNWKLKMLIRTNSRDVTTQEPYISILNELCTEKQRKRIRLRTTKFVNVPMIMGLRNAFILIPADIDSSDKEVMFALRHEIYHYVHHDLWLKFAVNCLVAAYWWNPFTHLLSREIGVLLEMRVDDSIISEGKDTTIGYLACMVHYMGGDPDRDDTSSRYSGLAFEKKSSLSRRFHMIENRKQKHNYLLSTVMLLIMVSLYIGSYIFIFENSTYGQEICESNTYVVPSEEDCFAIQNGDNTYTIYFPNWGYSETTDSLEYYPKIKVYSNKEEYNETFKNP